MHSDGDGYFCGIFGGDVAIADCEDGGGGEVEGVEVKDELVGGVEAEGGKPGLGVADVGGEVEDEGLSGGIGTTQWRIRKRVVRRSTSLEWYS